MMRFLVLSMAMMTLSVPSAFADLPRGGQEKTYSVLMVTGLDKSVTFEVATEDVVKDLKLGLEKEFRDAVKIWEAARKEAKAKKEEFTDPKPNKPQVKILKKGLTKESKEFRDGLANKGLAMARKSRPASFYVSENARVQSNCVDIHIQPYHLKDSFL